MWREKSSKEWESYPNNTHLGSIIFNLCSFYSLKGASFLLFLHINFYVVFIELIIYRVSIRIIKLSLKCVWYFSHKKKRAKQIKKLMQRGLLDPEKVDPFSLFVESGNITYCLYRDSERILGNTFGMCILQVCCQLLFIYITGSISVCYIILMYYFACCYSLLLGFWSINT